jgi:hypothetical protein
MASSFFPGIFGSQKISVRPRTSCSPPSVAATADVAGFAGDAALDF